MDRYSRLVAFLKVVLPLAALALLSSLFLLSRSVDPTDTLPYGDGQLPDRLRGGQVMTEPFFSGQTDQGEEILFTADAVRPGEGGEGASATAMRGQIALQGGNVVAMMSDSGQFLPESDLATLSGDVEFNTSSGYQLRSEELRSSLSGLAVESPGAVRGSAPIGNLQAGRMELRRDPGTGQAQLLFTNGVKLVYDPKNR